MKKARLSLAGFLVFAVPVLLVFWASRVAALEALPLHNDEGLHLTRAVEVWNGNPFWEIRDGKIINHWLIAALYPQNASAFIGRIATVFVVLVGVAALLAMLRRWGRLAVILGALLWAASPFMFFYDRMAFSDSQAGALGLLALWAALQPARATSGGTRNLGGMASVVSAASWHIALALALAMLFKFTAAPYALSVALLVLARRAPLRHRLRTLAIIAAVVAAAFVVPVAVLLLRGSSLFDIALDWVGAGGSGGGSGLTLVENSGRLASLLWWGNPLLALMLVLGWAGTLGWLFASGKRQMKHTTLPQRLAWMAACLIPMTAILVLGRDAQSRHFAAAMPPLAALAGIGLAWMMSSIHLPALFRGALAAGGSAIPGVALAAALAIPFIPFALNAYRDPAALNMPPLMAWQYVEGYASGYGLREAVERFPTTLPDRSLHIVGSMYGDSCRRANFYARDGRVMQCGDAPMRETLETALAQEGAVYVLVERGGDIGIDVTTLGARVELLGVYPRPNETEENAGVRLWRLESEGVRVP